MKQLTLLAIFLLSIMHSIGQTGLDPFDQKIKPFKGKDKFGYKNEKGKIKIPAMYDKVGFFQNGLACVTLNNQVALINTSGKIIVPFGTYDNISAYHDGTARVVKAGKTGFLDKTGREIIPCSFDKADFFRNGLSVVRKNNKEGIINTEGTEIIQVIYDKLFRMPADTLVKIENEGKWGYINNKGKIFVNPEYDELDQCINGMIRVKNEGKYGFLNDKGVLVIPCKYDRAGVFSEAGSANVDLEQMKGVVLKDGTEKFTR